MIFKVRLERAWLLCYYINMENLNKEQKKAVLATEGPLLILAGAGSGKTSTMTHRIAHLIKGEGVDPYNILAVTFTNKAAGEMRDRVEALLGENVNMWIMTFHAACLRILRRNADLIGYGRDFVVYDPVDTKSLMKKILKELNIDDKQFSPVAMLSEISRQKEREITPERYLELSDGGYRTGIIHRIYERYNGTLKKSNAMDFDDLLLNTVKLFDADADTLAHYQKRFKYIMVDEYQDTNRIQYRFIKMLASKHRNICVVGDDDQCIYQWRGADITNILNFEKDFKGAKVIKLEQNYRSTGNILAAAHSVIKNNTERKGKKLWTAQDEGSKICYRRAEDEKDEAGYVAQEIDRLNVASGRYSDFAILYRTNSQSRNFEEALSGRRIPYRVVGGIRYYDRKEIKDIVAYMRLVMNPKDDLSLTRIINSPKRGIGNTTVNKLTTLAEAEGSSLFDVLLTIDDLAGISAKGKKGINELVVLLQTYNENQGKMSVSEMYDGLLNDTGYLASLEAMDNAEADARIENLLEFKTVISEYEGNGNMGLSEFLERIALLSDIDNYDADADAVSLMTMHSAKGLEFPFVFIVGMEDGLFPGWRSMDDNSKLEEERRLCYVGMTRAKKRLCLTGAEYRMLYGKGSYTRESTFMRELDMKLVEGDGVLEKKNEARLGSEKYFDGYLKEDPYRPFDRLARAKKEVKASAHKEVDYSVGERVRHSKFGEGMIIEIDGNILKVAFDGEGIKKLAKNIAPLDKVR